MLLWIQTIVSIHWVFELGNNSIKMACLNGLSLGGILLFFCQISSDRKRNLTILPITSYIIKAFIVTDIWLKSIRCFFFKYSTTLSKLKLYIKKKSICTKNYISTNLIITSFNAGIVLLRVGIYIGGVLQYRNSWLACNSAMKEPIV